MMSQSKLVCYTTLVVAVLSVGSDPPARGNQTSGQPNVLLIVVDDQSPFDLKIYNPRSQLQTPNIDRLARDGTVLDAAYHMGAWVGGVCTPSRHMIMSGRTLWHIPDKSGRKRNNPNVENRVLVPSDLAQQTLPAVFNREGYVTMRTCKRGNSYEAANKLFQVRRDATKRGGTDTSGSAWHADQVLAFLEQRAADQDRRPFLVYFGFSHPHDPRNGTPELLAKYGAVNHADESKLPAIHFRQPPLPVNYLPEHPFQNSHMGVRDEVAVKGVWRNRDAGTIRNEVGREFACSENIDIQVGRVLEKLRSTNELDNTVVIYTSDHGMAIGRHGLQGKQNLYEHTWRVPLIVKGPGVKTGHRVRGNVYLLDLLATVCDLAAIDTPETNEGISFRSVLEGNRDSVRDVLFGVYCGGSKPGMRCVRKGKWKLIKYETSDGSTRQTQLFDLEENPHELLREHHAQMVATLVGSVPNPQQVNLAGDPLYAERLAEMEQLLDSEMRRHDDPYRFWNQTEP